jgi:hypothetical protein
MKKRKFGKHIAPGGRMMELTAEHYEWLEWANDWLNIVSGLEVAVRLNDQDAIKKYNEAILKNVIKNVPMK